MKDKGFSDSLDIVSPLKWIILSRAVFGMILSFSCLIFSTSENLSLISQPFLSLYNISGFLLVMSIIYILLVKRIKNTAGFAYFQLILDTFCVTAIIFVTGSFESIFTFLYLVVIICGALLLLQRGSLVIALVSSIQYSILIEFEYYKIITPFVGYFNLSSSYDERHIIYRIIIVVCACFAVAVLSGILASQTKRAKQDLKIAQEHLKRVEKMAAMDEMLAGIAHEIKNPLASLSGSIQLLNEDTKSGSYEDKLMRIILRETDRLKEIVNDIRLFARPKKTGASDIQIDKAITEIVEIFVNNPKWHGKIKITLRLDQGVFVFIDPAHLKQIFWNLLKNAAEAIEDKGEIFVNLRAFRHGRVYLTISDTGKGIDKTDAKQIFDPFYTTKPEGTGLGLSIIHRLIDTYDGMIDFESDPGIGTVFTLVFKRSRKAINGTKS